jgi:eukaryotic-like serine/threonine-protein kinase
MTTTANPVEALFYAAVAKAPAEQTAFLDAACGPDAELRRKVERLLAAQPAVGAFLEHPAAVLPTIDFPTSGGPGPTDRPGLVLAGKYELVEPIGEGGMGTVWMARQTTPVQRLVAVKLIRAGMDSRTVLARFEAERQALALMDHPNIAKVFDGGVTADAGSGRDASGRARPFFVMELVRGVPITTYCDEHRLTLRQRLELFVPICHAVQHAHQKGVIHRDLKPSNVLVALYDDRPVPKVIDFGVAKATREPLTDETLHTGIGAVVGTVEYMSPEQASLDHLDVDTRSDIYSLGVMLYELLAGSPPLTRGGLVKSGVLELLRVIREEEPARPSTRLGSADGLPTLAANRGTDPGRLPKLVRGELDWIAMKALEKDRSRRYETANSFAMDVQRYLADEPVLAGPPSVGYRVRKFARRNRGPVLAASLVALALVAGMVGTTWGMFRADRARAETAIEAGRTANALMVARQSKRDADEKLLASYQDEARAIRVSRRPGQRFESLAAVQRAADLGRALGLPDQKFDELRDAAVAALALPDLNPVGPWHPWSADGYSIDFDEALPLYVRTDRRGNCSVRRVADDTEVQRLPGRGWLAAPVLSPDGEFVAVAHYTEGTSARSIAVEVWKLGPTAAVKVLLVEGARGCVFHPRLPRCALVFNDGTISAFELPGGRLLKRLLPVTLRREVGLAFHPTEPLIAVYSWFAPVVEVRDLGTGAVVAQLRQDGRPTGVAWHPGGRTLAVGQAVPDRIRMYDFPARRVVRSIETPVTVPVAFNPAGDRLLSVALWAGGIQILDTGTGQPLFTDSQPSWPGKRFSRDGRRVSGATRNGKVGRWEVGDGREMRTLVRQNTPAKAMYSPSVTVSPDGRLVAAGTTDGFGLWDLASGSELAFVPLPPGPGNRVVFEPSGALLVLGVTGLARWTVRPEPGAAGTLVVGPPEPLPLPIGSAVARSTDGRVIVTCSRAVDREQPHAGGYIWHADRPDPPIRVAAGADLGWITVSPDGRWVVTVTHGVGLAKVWDSRDGREVRLLTEFGAGYVRFSPDGRWLSTAVDGGRVFAVGTWDPGPQLGNAGTFAPPDGKLVAMPPIDGANRLVDPATGRTLVKLEDPDQQPISGTPVFTPDGTRLIGVGGKGLRVWDLPLVRRQLAEMGLDWDAPAYPPADPENPTAAPKVEVRRGESAPATSRVERARQAIALHRKRAEAHPEDARCCNNLAWVYLTAPSALRDVAAAVSLAEKAVRLAPGDAIPANTLGIAYYRAGRYSEAADVLRANLTRQEDVYLAFDLYFLAMTYHKLGDTGRARDYYEWAVRWPRIDARLTSDQIEELEEFRADASALLGIEVWGPVETGPPPREVKP